MYSSESDSQKHSPKSHFAILPNLPKNYYDCSIVKLYYDLLNNKINILLSIGLCNDTYMCIFLKPRKVYSIDPVGHLFLSCDYKGTKKVMNQPLVDILGHEKIMADG
jgi:hypothetical protein